MTRGGMNPDLGARMLGPVPISFVSRSLNMRRTVAVLGRSRVSDKSVN